MSPCIVTYDSLDLGGTLGNVTVEFKYTKGEIKMDQSGSTVRDRVINGVECKVTTEITQIKDKAIWDKVFPNATYTATGTKAIDWVHQMTTRDSAGVKVLKLHPMDTDAADASEEYTFPKAIPSEESSITYGPNEQQKLKIVWNCYMDTTLTPPRFFRFGDTAI